MSTGHPVPSMLRVLLLAVLLSSSLGPTTVARADTPLADRTLASDELLGDPPPVDDCGDGVVLDDGSTEIGWGWVPSVLDGRYVQEFQGNAFPLQSAETVCVCWRRSSTFPTNDDTIDFEVVFYDSVPNPDLGDTETFERVPARRPFASVPATATGVPVGQGAFYAVDVGNVAIPPGTFYAGVRWDASVDRFFFTCVDTSAGTTPVDGYFIEEQADSWTSVFKAADPNFQFHRAFLYRIRPGSQVPIDIPVLGAAGLVVLLLLLALLASRRLRGLEKPS